jgi:hypothetical protein
MTGAALYAALSRFPPGWLLPMAATSAILTLAVTVHGYLRMRFIEKRTFDLFMNRMTRKGAEPPGD